ncbi:MAG: Pr6Pr family membrane protein [Dokdonella sp.]
MLAILRTSLALLTLAAIGLQFSLHLNASHSALNFFSYFTNLSNLFACFVLLVSASATRGMHSPWRDGLRFVSTANMLVVGIVFVALLRDADLGGLLPWINILLHYVMPCAIVIDWLLDPPSSRLGLRHLAVSLVFPLLYLGYVVVRGTQMGWYPYPFLNPAIAGGSQAVALHAVAIAVAFAIAGGILLLIGNRLLGRRLPSVLAQ